MGRNWPLCRTWLILIHYPKALNWIVSSWLLGVGTQRASGLLAVVFCKKSANSAISGRDGRWFGEIHGETVVIFFLSSKRLGEGEGACGDVVLQIEIPGAVIAPYEWVEEGKPYREFCVPVELVNEFGPPTIYEARFSGISHSDLLDLAMQYEQLGKLELASEIRAKHLPFLEKHRLLETPKDRLRN